MTPITRVREAIEQDIPRLVELGEKFFDMTGLDRVTTYDPASIETLLKCLTKDSNAVILVLDIAGYVVGVAGAVITPFYFNRNSKVAQEFFWYIEEEHRGTLASIRLFRDMERWAREQGADVMDMTALAYNRAPVDMFYKRQGYNEQETHYMRRLT